MSWRQKLRTIFVCVMLEYAALCGTAMRPEEIEDLLRNMNRRVLAHVNPEESHHGATKSRRHEGTKARRHEGTKKTFLANQPAGLGYRIAHGCFTREFDHAHPERSGQPPGRR